METFRSVSRQKKSVHVSPVHVTPIRSKSSNLHEYPVHQPLHNIIIQKSEV